MASLLNAPSFLLNAVCSLYNYIPLCIFAYHCSLQMVLFEHWNAASVTSATSLVHPAEIVKVHFVSIGNVSPLADVQNIWTAVAKVKSGSWDFHSPKRDATFPLVETLTRRNPTKFSSSSQLRFAQLVCFFFFCQINFWERSMILKRSLKAAPRSSPSTQHPIKTQPTAGAGCQHAGANSEGLSLWNWSFETKLWITNV